MRLGDKPLTEFLQGVGRDFALQAKFFGSDPEQFVNDPEFARLLEQHGWSQLPADQQELIQERNLAGIAEALEKESNPGIGPCWVLVRV